MTVSHCLRIHHQSLWEAGPGSVLSETVFSIEPIPDEGLQVPEGRALTWHPMGTLGWDLGAPGFLFDKWLNLGFVLGVVVLVGCLEAIGLVGQLLLPRLRMALL